MNIKAVLEAAGSSLDKVLSRKVYLTDMDKFRMVDIVWSKHMKEPYPVSTCVQVSVKSRDSATGVEWRRGETCDGEEEEEGKEGMRKVVMGMPADYEK